MSDKMEELIRSDREAYEDLHDAAMILKDLSDAFYTTGNNTMGTELLSASTTIRRAASTLRGNNSERTNIRFKEAHESSANILSAALAVSMVE